MASRIRHLVTLFGAALAFLALGAWPADAQELGRRVLVARIDGPITPVYADHIQDAVEAAVAGGYEALIVELDTPGGLDTAMRDIVQSFLSSRVPVVVHVAPAGARAASAGFVIGLSADVFAMAPGTATGAATPVDLEGATVSDKIVNDAAAYVEALAELRGRDVAFAIDAVRDGRSAAAQEAVEIGVADLLAGDLIDLLAAIDGQTLTLESGGEVTMLTVGATVERFELRGFRQWLQWLADPNLAFIFLSLGTLAIIYELANPGVGLGGTVGLVFILLAMFSLSVLPVNATGVILVVAAAALFVAELVAPGVGALAAGAVVCLLLGGIFLFEGSIRVHPGVLVPTTAVAGGLASVVVVLAWRSRAAPPRTGASTLLGRRTVITIVDAPGVGRAKLDGAWWNARSAEPLEVGTPVEVVAVDGLTLVVARVDAALPLP